MKKSDMWLTVLASVGVGAAAYYTMSKSSDPMTKAMESVAPMLTNMNNDSDSNSKIGDGSNSGLFGPHGMS